VKRTQLERLKAAGLANRMKAEPAAERYGKGSASVGDRRERRRLEREKGLVPFAVKLDATLAAELRALAEARGADLGVVVAELLRKGLAR